ncbi:MAG: hypothetical protein AAGA03_06465, partial [Planctomycetota bacterium]
MRRRRRPGEAVGVVTAAAISDAVLAAADAESGFCGSVLPVGVGVSPVDKPVTSVLSQSVVAVDGEAVPRSSRGEALRTRLQVGVVAWSVIGMGSIPLSYILNGQKPPQ